MNSQKQRLSKRFWAKVNKDGPKPKNKLVKTNCWEWVGEIEAAGYGLLYVKDKAKRAHRVSYEIHTCTRLSASTLILHRCDNRACVRPDHLYAGSHADNAADKSRAITKLKKEGKREKQKRFPFAGYTVQERFWMRVKKTAKCWNWIGVINSGGYGLFHDEEDQKMVSAHRWVYAHYKGQIPKHLVVMHTCDNTRCVKPDHLKLGAHDDNMCDMARKGRAHKKLTEKQVKRIWALYKKGLDAEAVAKRYNISKKTVLNIVGGRGWKHLQLPIIVRARGAKILTEAEVKRIWREYKRGKSSERLAKQYNINPQTVLAIVSGKSWRNLNLPIIVRNSNDPIYNND